MRYLFTRQTPPFDRILLVESGSRQLLENLLPGIYETYGGVVIDLLTCYAGVPSGLNEASSRVYRVTDYPDPAARERLFAELRRNGYSVVGIICSAEPIMTKWKWVAAWKLPAKLFILNENGDYFWFDWFHRGIVRHFILYRAGLTGSSAVRTIVQLALFPFTVLYLLLFAAWVHLRRWLFYRKAVNP